MDFDDKLLMHYDKAKLFEGSEFDKRFQNENLLENSEVTEHLNNTEERYTEFEFISEGGVKRVDRCTDIFTDRVVAYASLKSIASEKELEKFLEEARMTAYLQHPNIIPVYDLGIDQDRRPFYTMKLAEGDNLKTIIDKLEDGNRGYTKNYPMRVRLNIFLKICDAIV